MDSAKYSCYESITVFLVGDLIIKVTPECVFEGLHSDPSLFNAN